MPRLPTILIDDDEGHAILIRRSFAEIGLINEFVEFRDGQAVLDFLLSLPPTGAKSPSMNPFVVLLDIRMPRVDGVEVLRRIKADPRLNVLPVIMLSTTDDPREVDRCHGLGCCAYVRKPIDYDSFAEAVRRIGEFIRMLAVPQLAS